MFGPPEYEKCLESILKVSQYTESVWPMCEHGVSIYMKTTIYIKTPNLLCLPTGCTHISLFFYGDGPML